MNSVSNLGWFYQLIADFCFGYPFVMSWYWITGAIVFYFIREARQPQVENPSNLPAYPLVSLLLPCYNEEEQIEETIAALTRVIYPNLEIIAINDGSKDKTLDKLKFIRKSIHNLRIANLVENQGKSTALNVGLQMAKGEILVCIDGDALLDPYAINWLVERFLSNPKLGGLTGNPRIRNRSSLLGRMQVGEFSSIVGMIKRTQTVFGSLFTVSGVICAFRKVAVLEAGLWNPAAMTDDVDLTLRVQIAGWYVDYVPQAMCWILMPETLRGLWKQRLRWATGGAQAALGITKLVIIKKAWRLIFIWLNFFISSLWAYCIWFCVLMFFIDLIFDIPSPYPSPIPDWWGTVLACTYIFQSLIGILLDLKYEKGSFRYIYWLIWYPIAFWLLSTSCALFGILIAIKRPKNIKGTWISPDRGIR